MVRIFQHHTSGSQYFSLITDAALCFVAMVASAITLDHPVGMGASGHVVSLPLLTSAAFFSLVIALLNSFVGLHRSGNLMSFGTLLSRSAMALMVGGAVAYLGLTMMNFEGHPGQLVGYALLYLSGGLALYRSASWALRHAVGTRRVLIVGTGAEALQVWSDLRLPAHASHYEVVGFYPTAEQGVAPILTGGARIFERDETLVGLAQRYKVAEIIVAVKEQRGGGVPMEQLLHCRISGVPILSLVGFYERTRAEVPVDSVKASWLVYGDGFVQGKAREISKRVFDIVTSSLLLVMTTPIMIITAMAIKLDSPGPLIYRQERVGLAGATFWCLKFRSMRTDAEKDGVARWATKNDSRITRVGAFIRKTRIDELPQLLSVLRGEMSMVGPRPERPSFVAQLREQIPFYDVRHTVKPGLTGWAQVRYAYGASVDDARKKHQYDLYYVKNNSLFLDLLVLLETVSVVLFREGAH
ncbi:TIGR03013 family XrtA/PEP-CTERM system glycosyltransferase [Leptothrix ochracea]|uniref:TIGR03013 family XrtA/PEP-CTERM system glycosyltransferase n=1 Tax=Leptothrix ochracea TaxID=735331 RepID=UPI0034E1DB2B